MNVIVSNIISKAYNNFTIVQSFKDLSSFTDIVSVVIHTFNDTSFDVGMAVSNLSNLGVKKFAYIRDKDEMDNFVSLAVNGVSGLVLTEEFYYDDEEELIEMLNEADDITKSTALSTVSSVTIISDFIQSFMRNDDRIRLPLYLEQVSNAVEELANVTKQQELVIEEMGTTAIDIFKKASTAINALSSKREELLQQIKTLESLSTTQPKRDPLGYNVNIFPSYKYIGGSKVLLIKELTPCRYLTSFLLGYVTHVKNALSKRVKLIIVHQKGYGILKRYSYYPSITQESINEKSLFAEPIVCTNNPKKEVMSNLMHCSDDIIIVLDRMYSSDDIVSNKLVKLYGISGYSSTEVFNVKPEDCIFSITRYKQCLFIPHIKNYGTNPTQREAHYNNFCIDAYQAIDNMLSIK